MIEHLERLYEKHGTWRAVADHLATFGASRSGAWWSLIARGKRAATNEDANTIRRAVGLPEVTQTPAEAVASAGVQRVVSLSKRANTALLVAVSGDVCQVSIKTGVLPDGEIPKIRVTLGYKAPVRRSVIRGSSLWTTDELTRKPPKTRRGHSVNFQAVSMILSEAVVIYQEMTQ